MKALILEGKTARETSDYAEVAAAHTAGTTFWIDLGEHSEESNAFLEQTLAIHPLAVEDIWRQVELPKVEDFGEYLVIVVHGVRHYERQSKDVDIKLAELDVVIGKNWVVTYAHDAMVFAIRPLQLQVCNNPRLLEKGPAWVGHAVMDRMVDEYAPLIERFDEQIETETQILEGSMRMKMSRKVIPRIVRIKRSLQGLRRTTIYQREILLRLARGEFDQIPHELVPFYRDIYDHFTRLTELVDSYRELVTSLLEAQFSMQSTRLNAIMKQLTMISTIMLPLSLIASIYGMNFRYMPELHWRYGYPAALGLMLAVAMAILVSFRRNRWI